MEKSFISVMLIFLQLLSCILVTGMDEPSKILGFCLNHQVFLQELEWQGKHLLSLSMWLCTVYPGTSQAGILGSNWPGTGEFPFEIPIRKANSSCWGRPSFVLMLAFSCDCSSSLSFFLFSKQALCYFLFKASIWAGAFYPVLSSLPFWSYPVSVTVSLYLDGCISW